MKAQDFVNRIDLDAMPAGVAHEAYVVFARSYLQHCDFDTALMTLDLLWFPDVLARYENAMQVFGRESGLFVFAEQA